jgi:lambda family phage portal protein
VSLREVPRITPQTIVRSLQDNIRPNVLDKLIQVIAPGWAVERMKSKAMLAMGGWSGWGGFLGGGWRGSGEGGSYPGGYTGARLNRRSMQAWRLRNNSADSDVIFDLPILRDRSRDLIRNAPLACGAVNTVCQNVIGNGLQLQSQIEPDVLGITEDEASKWQEKTEREFRLWAESVDCDVTRTQNFYGLQNLAFRSALESGDVLSLLPMDGKTDRIPYSLRVQLIEADRLVNPYFQRNTITFCGGVEMDDAGAPIAYHIMRRHPGSIDRSQMLIWDRYPAFGTKTKRRNVLHLYDKTRPGQTRGVPYLTPVIETIKQLDRYTEAEVMAAVVAAMFTVFIKTEESEELAPQLPNISGNQAAVNTAENEVGLGSGAIVDLNPGEDISTFMPNRPNSGYDLFMQSMFRQIGMALGIPFEVLIKHFTASYSASRAALLDAWRFFRNRRAWVSDGFCQPVYEAWMDEAVSIGRVKAPGYFSKPAIRQAWLQASWVGDSPMQIDPVKEVEAADKRLAIGVSTLAEETMQLTAGIWTDKLRQQTKERKLRLKAGLIASTEQTTGPAQAERITVADPTIPGSGQPPAKQPGGGGASPAVPSNTAPQTPGQPGGTPATPAAPPAPAPAKKPAALVARITAHLVCGKCGAMLDKFNGCGSCGLRYEADGTLDDLQNPPAKEKKSATGKDKKARPPKAAGENPTDDEAGDEEDEVEDEGGDGGETPRDKGDS